MLLRSAIAVGARQNLAKQLLGSGIRTQRRSYAEMLFGAGHTYKDAINKLNGLQTSYAVLEARKAAGDKYTDFALVEMRDCLRRLGYKPSDLDGINIVHVAGTKGKGTTCAYVNSILSAYQAAHAVPRKIGLFTSPHLLQVRERIQINSTPISEALFARYFFDVWNRLEATARAEGTDPDVKPVYFRFLTLMSLHLYVQEGVDAAIYEVGIGGAYDATNVFEKPAVTGISALGIDHVLQLGHTIEEISWHKAGIMKTGSPAFSVPQPATAMEVLEKVAAEKSVELKTVSVHPGLQNVKVLPDADFQRSNVSLAIALSNTVLEHLGQDVSVSRTDLPDYVVRGVEDIRWRGRCEVKKDGLVTWYLDGAHTADSLAVAATWFGTQIDACKTARVLVFNQQSRLEAKELLAGFQRALRDAQCFPFTHIIFCTNVTWKTKGYNSDLADFSADNDAVATMSTQRAFAEAWKAAGPERDAEILCLPTLEEVVELVRRLGKENGGAQALVTGSFRHMGGVLSVLEGKRED